MNGQQSNAWNRRNFLRTLMVASGAGRSLWNLARIRPDGHVAILCAAYAPNGLYRQRT